MENDKNKELEKILSELNSNIKKSAAHEEEDPAAEKPAKPDAPEKKRKTGRTEKPAAESVPEPEEMPPPKRKPAIKPVEVVAEESIEDREEPEGKAPRKPSAKKTKTAGDGEAVEIPEDAAAKPRKSAAKNQRKRPQPDRAGESVLQKRLEETAEAAEDFIEDEKRSFVESARIIEDELSDRELRKPAVRHIAVTAAEVVAEEAAVEPPRKRKAFDQQKNLPETGETQRPPNMPQRKRKRMSRRERTTAILGVLVTIFVLIGVVSTVVVGVNFTRNLVNSTAAKEELAKVIFPLVIVDIPEFESPESLDNAAIIQSSIWSFIIDEADKSKYPKDDLGAMTVPDTDIEPYIRRLYGNDVKIQHQSIDDASVQMLYDSENKRYIIESTPRFLPYTPRVDKIARTGDIYTLRVSYVLPDALWNLEKDHNGATVDKVMEYRLKRNKDTYQMLSVKLLEVTGRSEQGADSSTQPVMALPEDDFLPESSLPSSEASVSGENTDTSGGAEDGSGGDSSAESSTGEGSEDSSDSGETSSEEADE